MDEKRVIGWLDDVRDIAETAVQGFGSLRDPLSGDSCLVFRKASVDILHGIDMALRAMRGPSGPDTIMWERWQRFPDKPADTWAHRSEGMRCKTCMWFVEKEFKCPVCKCGWGQKHDESCRFKHRPLKLFGRCRKHSPTLQGFPAVFGDDWCGDHKLDETKV